MKNQWECFTQNYGEWQGSFTEFSPDGEQREHIPSVLKLEGTGPNTAKLILTRKSPKHPEPLVMEFQSFSRGLVFFETGAFCQGSMQFAPHSQFGAEFAIVTSDRRLRMVQMYDTDSRLKYVTLIREKRAGSTAYERPAMTVDDLVGTWQGEGVTILPDLSVREFTSTMTIERQGDRLNQQIAYGTGSIATSAKITGTKLIYDQSALPVQILLLPDSATANCPTAIKLGNPFVLEVGWLEAPGLRHRCMRSFDAKGEWIGVTLVTERRVSQLC
jgi:hypothetical protein